jgi:hypothetical protein
MPYSEMLRRESLVRIDVSKERIASITRLTPSKCASVACYS